MFIRVILCFMTLGLMACSMTEDHPEQEKQTSYHEISLPRQTEEHIPSRPAVQQAQEQHVNNCQVFFDATLASAAAKLVSHKRM
jgi:hypothetical protein